MRFTNGPMDTSSSFPVNRTLSLHLNWNIFKQRTYLWAGNRYWVFDGDRMVEENSYLDNLGLPDGLDQLDAAFVWGKNKKTYFFRYLISLYWFPAVAHLIGIAERIFTGATTTSKDKWIPDIRTICPGGGVCRPTSTRLCSGPTVIFFVIKLKIA